MRRPRTVKKLIRTRRKSMTGNDLRVLVFHCARFLQPSRARKSVMIFRQRRSGSRARVGGTLSVLTWQSWWERISSPWKYSRSKACSDGLAMILQEDSPTLGWLRVLRCTLHPARDSSLCDVKSKFQQFAMEYGGRPKLGFRPPYGKSTLAALC